MILSLRILLSNFTSDLIMVLIGEVQESARMTVPGGPSIACSTAAAIAWDKAWADNLDPSGRAALGVHDAAYSEVTPATTTTTTQSSHENVISANSFNNNNPLLGNILQPQGVQWKKIDSQMEVCSRRGRRVGKWDRKNSARIRSQKVKFEVCCKMR